MNQKLKAAGITAGILGATVLLTIGFKLVFTYLTLEMMPFVITILGIGMCVYVMYNLILNQIQYKDQLKSTVDKK